VKALLIIDTGPGYKKDEPREGWNVNARKTADNFEKNGLKGLQSGSAERATAAHKDHMGLARAARGMLTQKNARVITSLPEIKAPSIVVVGEKDTPFLAASDYMAAKIPHATKAVIPNAGHAANIDNPEAFNKAIADFISILAA
jgi:pimeloyl-ACP methyl ester carboxylesterase